MKLLKVTLKLKATFDNGTSVRLVYRVDWTKFEDGGEVPVKIFHLYPAGRLEFSTSIICSGAQSYLNMSV